MQWKDYLFLAGLVLFVVGLVMGLAVYEAKMEQRMYETRCYEITQKLVCFSEHRKQTTVR